MYTLISDPLKSGLVFFLTLYITPLNVFISWLLKEALLNNHRNKMLQKYPMESSKYLMKSEIQQQLQYKFVADYYF